MNRILSYFHHHPNVVLLETNPHTEDILKMARLESIESYIEKGKVQVTRHLSPESKVMTDIANSVDIEINMCYKSYQVY